MFHFKSLDYLTDGEIELIIDEKREPDEKKGYVPSYLYKIRLHGQNEVIGSIEIRIGDNENIYFGGHIGYGIEEGYRGKHYAGKACRLIKQIAVAHGMENLIITCNPYNIASRKTCEWIGATLDKIVDLPSHNEMYLEGELQKCIYCWRVA